MANYNTDQQILELLQIKLGLEKKSQGIFRQLLAENANDPLDQLFKGLTRKNKEIQNLRRELEKSKLQITQLNKKNNPSSQQSEKSSGPNQIMSLPQDHQISKKKIEENKRVVTKDREFYQKKIESFIVFLLKCIRIISKMKNESQQKIQQVEAKIKEEIQKHRIKIFEEQVSESKQRSSQASTKPQKTAQNRLADLVLVIKKKSKQDPEKMFGEINKALGLSSEWESYIEKIKQQTSIFEHYKQIIRQKDTSVDTEKLNILNWKEQVNSLFNFEKNKDFLEFKNQKIHKQIDSKLAKSFHRDQREVDDMVNKMYGLLEDSVNYCIYKFGEMLKKHNQHPLEVRIFKEKQEQILKGFIKNKQWNIALNKVKEHVNSKFSYMERTMKFYSSNRVIILNS